MDNARRLTRNLCFRECPQKFSPPFSTGGQHGYQEAVHDPAQQRHARRFPRRDARRRGPSDWLSVTVVRIYQRGPERGEECHLLHCGRHGAGVNHRRRVQGYQHDRDHELPVASLGNHEFDYGLPHLLFLEKIANFPIVNANLYITQYNKRLFQPYVVKNVDGFDILFIGIITEKVMDMLKTDNMLSSFITLQEAAAEVGKICNAYKNDDIDLTILLTHIGFESDKELASLLDPAWGVDMIIGGHSHTVLELSLIHISEPTRLGMISYAVFCLKKKNNKHRSFRITKSLSYLRFYENSLLLKL